VGDEYSAEQFAHLVLNAIQPHVLRDAAGSGNGGEKVTVGEELWGDRGM